LLVCGVAASSAQAQEPPARGEYLFHVAGCQACHTDAKNKGPLLGGGGPLKTPFGVFYGPNITAHPERGIGGWSDRDFVAALRDGVAPDGSHYFPVFPYTSFTAMTEADMLAIKAYIFSLPVSDRESRPHEIDFPFGWRFLMGFWKALFFEPGAFQPDPALDEQRNRGAYLANALGHCGECHTPRNALGALDRDRALAGTLEGPEGGKIPNITPDPETGIGKWSDGDLRFLLRSGLTRSGDAVGGAMAEVVENGTSKLTEADLEALIAYLRALPPVENRIRSEKESDSGSESWQ
jgi:mono/diheme cytochrome c family protein